MTPRWKRGLGGAARIFGALVLAACAKAPTSPGPTEPTADAQPPADRPGRGADAATDDAGVDRSEIDASVRARLVDIRACYDARVAQAPDLEGTVFTSFAIDDSGAAGNFAFESDDLDDEQLNACLEGVLGSIPFPQAPSGESITVRYPFDFRAQRD